MSIIGEPFTKVAGGVPIRRDFTKVARGVQ